MSNGYATGEQPPAGHGVNQLEVPEEDNEEKREELSILGAASRTRMMESDTASAMVTVSGAGRGAVTLLDRMQDGDSPITEDDRARKRKKRVKVGR
jgi:hypothetical protein